MKLSSAMNQNTDIPAEELHEDSGQCYQDLSRSLCRAVNNNATNSGATICGENG